MRRIILDTETTGLKPGQIAQLTYCILEGTKLIKAVNYFFAVDFMPAQAENVHGLSKRMLDELSGGRVFGDAYNDILGDLSGNIFIAYNANFDIRFLQHELKYCGINWEPSLVFCPMKYMAPHMNIDGKKTNKKLTEVVNYFKIPYETITSQVSKTFKIDLARAHDARFDVAALAFVTNSIERKHSVNINDLAYGYAK